MLNRLKNLFKRDGRQQSFVQEIDPESFRTLARELHGLALLAERLWPEEHTFQAKIKRILIDMEQLNRLVSTPEFKQISPGKRLQLREGLIQSREQIIKTVQTAPSPTSTLQ